IDRVYIHQEPDEGGRQFVRGLDQRLRQLNYPGRAFVLHLPDGTKDLADLHVQNPQWFRQRLEPLLEKAEELDLAQPPPLAGASGSGQVGGVSLAGASGSGQTGAPSAVGLSAVAPEGVCLAQVEARTVEWLWPARLPLGKLTILDGDPGLGKS